METPQGNPTNTTEMSIEQANRVQTSKTRLLSFVQEERGLNSSHTTSHQISPNVSLNQIFPANSLKPGKKPSSTANYTVPMMKRGSTPNSLGQSQALNGFQNLQNNGQANILSPLMQNTPFKISPAQNAQR